MDPSITTTATAETPIHPILKELATLQQVADIAVDFEPSNYQDCSGYATSQKRRCKNDNGRANKQRIKELLEQFEKLKECPSTEEFYGDFEAFLKLTHCHLHRPDAVARFTEWRELRGQDGPSLPDKAAPAQKSPLVEELLSVQQSATPQDSLVVQEMPTVQDATVISSIESFSDLSITPPSSSPTIEDSQTTITPSTSPDPTPHKAMVQDFSSLSLGSHNKAGTSSNSDIQLDESDAQMISRCPNTPQRKGSLRDDSPVIKEIYRYLTPEEQCDGVVYVLEHNKCAGLFKIDVSEGENINNSEAKLIHQTQGGPFFGASKARTLAQVILQHHSLEARECSRCGERHEGWLKAPREMICETVVRMEDFVQLPAYTLQDGEMKLSPTADKIVKAMCSFSVKRLDTLMADGNEQTLTPADDNKQQVSESNTAPQSTSAAIKRKPIPMTTPPITRSISFVDIDKASLQSQAHDKMNASQPSLQDSARRRKRDSLSRLFRRSRENTPEEVGLRDRKDNGNGFATASPQGVHEEAMAFNIAFKSVFNQIVRRS